MYRTIYETDTGTIVICRQMSDELLAERLLKFTNQASLNVFTDDVNNNKVDLDTLTVVANPQTENISYWMRQKRRAELISSDWTQSSDSPLNSTKKTQWATYRQQLRDLPSSYPNPSSREDITWPTKPE